jgi:hypothetical protein
MRLMWYQSVAKQIDLELAKLPQEHYTVTIEARGELGSYETPRGEFTFALAGLWSKSEPDLDRWQWPGSANLTREEFRAALLRIGKVCFPNSLIARCSLELSKLESQEIDRLVAAGNWRLTGRKRGMDVTRLPSWLMSIVILFVNHVPSPGTLYWKFDINGIDLLYDQLIPIYDRQTETRLR